MRLGRVAGKAHRAERDEDHDHGDHDEEEDPQATGRQQRQAQARQEQADEERNGIVGQREPGWLREEPHQRTERDQGPSNDLGEA